MVSASLIHHDDMETVSELRKEAFSRQCGHLDAGSV